MKNVLLIFLLASSVFSAQVVTLREKIGQMIMTGFSNEGDSYDRALLDVQDYNLGGIILFRGNIEDGMQVQTLLDVMQEVTTDDDGALHLRRHNHALRTPHHLDLGC